MNKLIVKLKQHTPIIHFQHNHRGATLRASELKPKLDKYLIKYAFGDVDDPISKKFDLIKKYLVGWNENDTYEKMENKISFDYKVLIRPLGNPIVENIEKYRLDRTGQPIIDERTHKPKKDPFPCFFGNMGDDNSGTNEKYFVFNEFIQIDFFSFNSELLGVIEDFIEDFFFENNFGTRQSKGFGSFTVVSINGIETTRLPQNYVSWFDTGISSTKTFDYFVQKRLFEDIDIFYKTLRGGINDKGRARNNNNNNNNNGNVTLFYMKPVIFQYAKNIIKAQWEKKTIKENFYPTELTQQQANHPDLNYPVMWNSPTKYIIKDLLGLSLLEEWKIPYRKKIKKESSDGIERFKSPILLKPIKINGSYKIYIFFTDIPNYYFDKQFAISEINSANRFDLRTPPLVIAASPSFDLYDFLYYAFNTVTLNNLIPLDYRNTAKAKKIKGFYEQLRSNFNIGEE